MDDYLHFTWLNWNFDDVKPYEPLSSWLRRMCKNEKITELDLTLFSFLTGVLFGPFCKGLLYLIGFIVIYEIFFYIFSHGMNPYYTPLGRAAVICAAVFGYIGSRTFFNKQVIQS